MREDRLKQFFTGEISADALAQDVDRSVVQLDPIASLVSVQDMAGQFMLHHNHLVSLCDAALSGKIPPEALSIIAFALLASDTFEWDDEVISEVVSDWSAAEINYPLTEQTLIMHRGWLEGLTVPPARPTPNAANTLQGQLVSVRLKQPRG